MDQSIASHPVWEVYDLLRTARLNVGYYAEKTTTVKRLNLVFEIFLAIVVPSSAVAGLPIWQEQYGKYAWGILIAVAATLAVIKPFLQLSDKVQAYQTSAARYRTLEGELAELRSEIFQGKRYDKDMQEWLRRIRYSMQQAQETEPIEPVDDKLRNKIEERVKQELPADNFYVP